MLAAPLRWARIGRHRQWMGSILPELCSLGAVLRGREGMMKVATTIDDGATVGLIIDGEVVRGDGGTYPVHNPARPAEVVFDAPDGVGRAGRPSRGVGPPRPVALGGTSPSRACRPGLPGHTVGGDAGGCPPGWPLCSPESTARFCGNRSSTPGRSGEWVPPSLPWSTRHWPREHGSTASGVNRVVREPLGVVAAILPFNWPLSVLANKALPALLVGNTVVVKTPPTCPTGGAGPGRRPGRVRCRQGCSMPSTGPARSWARPWSTTPGGHGLPDRRGGHREER